LGLSRVFNSKSETQKRATIQSEHTLLFQLFIANILAKELAFEEPGVEKKKKVVRRDLRKIQKII
jgi:hypothetical protein